MLLLLILIALIFADDIPNPQQMFGLTMVMDTCRYHELKTSILEIKYKLCLLMEEGTCHSRWKKYDDEYERYHNLTCPPNLD